MIARINNLVNQIKETPIDEANDLTQRLVRLQSSVATIKVGGNSEIEVTEKKHRIEDALEAVRSAQEEGIVSGGSSCLRALSMELRSLTASDIGLTEEQTPALNIVAESLLFPTVVMASNAGLSSDEIYAIINSDVDYDFLNLKFCNLQEAGIIDPFKVVRTSLKNASSVAKTLLTTNVSIVEQSA